MPRKKISKNLYVLMNININIQYNTQIYKIDIDMVLAQCWPDAANYTTFYRC